MSFGVPQIAILLGTLNAAILLVSLTFLPPRFRKPARYLGGFILGYTLYLFNWMIFPQIGYHYDVSIPWIPSLYFLPAFAYYFAKSIQITTKNAETKEWYYLLPGTLDSVFQAAKWIYVRKTIGTYVFPLNDKTEFFIYEGIGLIFSAFCISKIYKMIRNLSYKQGVTYVFYRHAFYFLIFVFARWIIMYSIDLFRPEWLTFTIQFSFWLMDLCFFLFLGYKSLITPNMYSTRLLSIDQLKPALQDESTKLISLLRDQELYLNPNLSRRDLSEKMQISEIKVSGILNDQLNTTFYGVINELRVEKAKRLLRKGLSKQLTLEGIAKESGFKSRTTFYKFFKRNTGMTPSEFLQTYEAQRADPTCKPA
ncbi:MAG: helix-turn-helix domain-containing protein [Cyclobacteriaceae bacterium]